MTAQEVARLVINAAKESYKLNGFDVQEIVDKKISSDFDFFIPNKRRIEKVYSYKLSGYQVNVKKYAEYRKNGFEVWAIVPLSSMGKAHDVLRNQVDWIQAWWIEDNSVKFSSPQRP